MIEIRAIVVLDDGIYLLRRDGTLQRLEPGGHTRPSGWSTEPVATRRNRA